MSKRPSIEVAREKHEKARLDFETARFTRGTKVLNKWDATEPNRLRKQPRTETKNEDQIYDYSKRLKGCNLGRDLERNYSPAKSMMHQLKVNVVGSLGKLRVNMPDDAGMEATEFFNEVWSKDCDFRYPCDWSTMVQNTLGSEVRDGDVLVLVDDGMIEDSGKLLTWESDQIAPVTDDVLAAKGFEGMKQDNGIIRDEWGREVAYCATGKRGAKVIDNPDDVTIWTRDQARLVRNPWRLNQGRGTPSLLTPSTNFIDLYEILASELMTAKRSAKQYAYIKRTDAITDWDNPGGAPEFLPENDGQTATTVDAEGANEATATGARNYEKLDSYTGGLADYLDTNDEVQFPDTNRPNKELAPFLEAVHGYGGSALGLARAYTILRADSSYTSFRGDMIMTWVTFYWLQKHLERTICDWTAIKVLNWAQRMKKIKALSEGWERKLSWTWPRMPEVDELDAQNAIAAALKNGTTDWSKLLGPDWETKLMGLGDQAEVIRKLNLPLAFFEGKSGGEINPKKNGSTE